MADRLNKKTRLREEDEQESPSEARTSLHNENHSSRIARIHPVRLRAMGMNVKLPHIYRDYRVHTFDSHLGSIYFIVPGDDMILVVHSPNKIKLFKRHGDQILAAEDGHGKHITYDVQGYVKSVCYNNHDDSFLIEYLSVDPEIEGMEIKIISLEIASIQAGQSPKVRWVFPGESNIVKWDVDIPMCRAMIHNSKERKFKFCELKEYSVLFTIPDFGSTQVGSGRSTLAAGPYFKSLSPGNMDMVMYDTVSSSLNGSSGFQLRFYSKLSGVLQKQIFLSYPSKLGIEFIALCGSDTLLVQRQDVEMEVVEMSSENPVSIIKRRNTKIRAACDPYYLHKRSQFICYTQSNAIHVCNLQGEILVTLADHPLDDGTNFRYVSLFVNCYISNSQDIVISLCRRLAPSGSPQGIQSVNVSSIVTGKCLAKITSQVPNCSQIRKAALHPPVLAFGYDGRTHEIFTGTQKGVCAVWSNKFHNDVGDVNLDEPEDSDESEDWDESEDSEESDYE